jgi:hypothetical protein
MQCLARRSSDVSPGRLSSAAPPSSSPIRSCQGIGGGGVCYRVCYRIGSERVVTGSHGLDESALSGLLTHQLKTTDGNGLDGSDHPLKVAARVRTPYGLPRSWNRSTASIGRSHRAPRSSKASTSTSKASSGRTPTTRGGVRRASSRRPRYRRRDEGDARAGRQNSAPSPHRRRRGSPRLRHRRRLGGVLDVPSASAVFTVHASDRTHRS